MEVFFAAVATLAALWLAVWAAGAEVAFVRRKDWDAYRYEPHRRAYYIGFVRLLAAALFAVVAYVVWVAL